MKQGLNRPRKAGRVALTVLLVGSAAFGLAGCEDIGKNDFYPAVKQTPKEAAKSDVDDVQKTLGKIAKMRKTLAEEPVNMNLAEGSNVVPKEIKLVQSVTPTTFDFAQDAQTTAVVLEFVGEGQAKLTLNQEEPKELKGDGSGLTRLVVPVQTLPAKVTIEFAPDSIGAWRLLEFRK
ncbi:hypothetical protein BK816_06540 [Boudabousia tangfeifanii]|uniref:Lipoprotein n=1 Tax=Boudabousia tangfeifanii TaxID=1912795 RepID=A0A1D9ML00_9ACTO|nr:hypothetical protein [Boudabousia tangfeifanii]AOZ72987.1 hypothetical protein BK816_06540 [Boudabousia tangfeifanii]